MAGWWSTHFVLPATLVSSSVGMETVIGKVEVQQPPPGSSSSSSRAPPAKRGRTGRKPNPVQTDNNPCNNYNQKKGSCAGAGPCVHGRRHACNLCGGAHREVDHGKDFDKSGGHDQDKGYWQKRKERKGKGGGKA